MISPISPRLVRIRFDATGDALWSKLYALGAPIQYSYLKAPLKLWHVQTVYAARPISAELP